MNPPTPTILPYLLEAVVGGAIGAFIAIAVSFFAKRPLNFVPDLLLGAAGYIGGALATAYAPWHQNTVTYRVGNTVVRSTMRHYQHPYRIAFILALLLPLIYEAIRFLLHRGKSSAQT